MTVKILAFASSENAFFLFAWHSGHGFPGQLMRFSIHGHTHLGETAGPWSPLVGDHDSRFLLQRTPRKMGPCVPETHPSYFNRGLAWMVLERSLHDLCTQCCVSKWCMSPLVPPGYKCLSNEWSHISEHYLNEAKAKQCNTGSVAMRIQLTVKSAESCGGAEGVSHLEPRHRIFLSLLRGQHPLRWEEAAAPPCAVTVHPSSPKTPLRW